MSATRAVTDAYLDVPGANLYYELRGAGPLLVLVAAPMGAESFAGLADLMAEEYCVLTTDPRGIGRSTVIDPDADSTPELRAADLAALIAVVDKGPAHVLGSSGGAVSVLALAQDYPAAVRTVVAHEPPLSELLPDHVELRTRTDDIIATYCDGDHLGAMRKFLAVANIHMPDEVFTAVFGGERTSQQVADDDYQYLRMLRSTTRWVPDLDKLRNRSRLVIGLGEDSTGELCERTSIALAEHLGTTPTYFPGGHIAFADDPGSFAPRLRDVLDGV